MKPTTPLLRASIAAAVAGALLTLSACGGGSSSSATAGATPSANAGANDTTSSAEAPEASFPTGVAIGSPGDLATDSSTLAAAPAGPLQLAYDWLRGSLQAIREGDAPELNRLMTAALPLGKAHALPGVGNGAPRPEIAHKADLIEKILKGDSSVQIASLLSMADLFSPAGGNNASCFGPSIAYASHEDSAGGSASGVLPSGDLGIWKSTTEDGTPCTVAQMRLRIEGAKRQTMQGLLMTAAMRKIVAESRTLRMPGAGSSVDLTSEFGALLTAALPSSPMQVTVATLTHDSDGKYSYRLVISNNATGTGLRFGEVILKHRPGGSVTVHDGVMQVSGFQYGNDAAFGCTDQVGSGQFKVARVSTLAYGRSGANIQYSSRSSHYCGHPTDTSGANYGAQVAAFGSDGQLDPAVKLTSAVRGATLGWRGSFTRFAGDFERDNVAGNFLLAWQAGTGDSHSRALAVNSGYNSASETRTFKGYYGYAGEIAATSGAMLGMICNWAGPGNEHTPLARFQSQTATKSSSASAFTLAANKLTYAPTRSCNSNSTSFDLDGNGTLAAAEGIGTMNDLDGLTGTSTTVAQELGSRGFVMPTRF